MDAGVGNPDRERAGGGVYLAGVLLLGAVPVLLSVAATDLPGNDAAAYYLRLAAALARGDWTAGFHHLIPPGFPVLTAALTWLGSDPYLAGKLVAAGFTLLGVPAVYGLARDLYGDAVGRWATILYLVSPQTLTHAASAGPDSAKATLLIYTAWFSLRYLQRGRGRWLAAAGASVGLMALMRSEGAVFAVVPVVAAAVRLGREWRAGSRARGRVVLDLLAALLVLAAVLSPWIWFEHRVTGYWVTDSRELKVLGRLGLVDPTAWEPFRQVTNLPGVVRRPHTFDWAGYLNGTLMGLNYAYVVLAALGVAYRWAGGRRIRLEEWLLLGLIALNLLVFWAAFGHVNSRYVYAGQAFLLGWAATGFGVAMARLRRLRAPWGARAAATVAVLFLVYSVWAGPVKKWPLFSAERRATAARRTGIVRWLRQHRGDLVAGPHVLASTLTMYHDGLKPVLLSAEPQYAFLAGADWVPVNSLYLHEPAAILAMCREYRVDTVLWSERLEDRAPGVRALLESGGAVELVQTWASDGRTVALYRCRPDASGRAVGP